VSDSPPESLVDGLPKQLCCRSAKPPTGRHKNYHYYLLLLLLTIITTYYYYYLLLLLLTNIITTYYYYFYLLLLLLTIITTYYYYYSWGSVCGSVMHVCQHDTGHAATLVCSMVMITAVVCGRAVCCAQHG
jgi:hypothetical protein